MFRILCAVLFAASSAHAAFIIDATTGYTRKPLSKGVLQVSHLIGATDLWPNQPSVNGKRNYPAKMDAAACQRLVFLARRWKAEELKWIIFDVENLDPQNNPSQCNDFIITCAGIIHKSAPGLKVGFYAVPPERDYWRAIGERGAAALMAWKRENRALMPAGAAVDAIFPSLYTFYDNLDGWKQYAAANIEISKIYGKPVYPFIWPRFHDSNKLLAWDLIPEDFWRQQVDFVFSHADGAVIWDWGKGERWDQKSYWWKAVIRHVKQN